jgi:hypothetical protein
MSDSLVRAIRKFREVRGTQKQVLLAIAAYCDDAGKGAFPAVKTIANDVGRSERAVQEARRELQRRGLLFVKYGKGLGGSNVYEIRTDRIYRATARTPVDDLKIPGADGALRGADRAPDSSGNRGRTLYSFNNKLVRELEKQSESSLDIPPNSAHNEDFRPSRTILAEMAEQARALMTDDELDASFDAAERQKLMLVG